MKIIAAIATAAALAFASSAHAATVNEGDLAGGEFSKQVLAPTVLGAGVTGVTGTGASQQFDYFVFQIAAGTTALTFDFTAPEGIGYSYSAGGTIKTSTSPFQWAWHGDELGTFHLGHGTPTARRTLEIDPTFAGALYVGLYFTYGSGISYGVAQETAASAAAPGVVPLPATGLLLLTALGGAAAMARRRA